MARKAIAGAFSLARRPLERYLRHLYLSYSPSLGVLWGISRRPFEKFSTDDALETESYGKRVARCGRNP